jgi:hypothetical protein
MNRVWNVCHLLSTAGAVLFLALALCTSGAALADDGVGVGIAPPNPNGPPGAPGCPFNNFARPCDNMCVQAPACVQNMNLCKVNGQCTTCQCLIWNYGPPLGQNCECQ